MGVAMQVKEQIRVLGCAIKKQMHLRRVALRQGEYTRARQLDILIDNNVERLRGLKRYGK